MLRANENFCRPGMVPADIEKIEFRTISQIMLVSCGHMCMPSSLYMSHMSVHAAGLREVRNLCANNQEGSA